jgi:hypothetical protein
MDAELTVAVLYSCPECGVRGRAVQVRARGEEDVLEWVKDACVPAISRDHELTSPECEAESMQNIKLPVGSGKMVGKVILQ